MTCPNCGTVVPDGYYHSCQTEPLWVDLYLDLVARQQWGMVSFPQDTEQVTARLRRLKRLAQLACEVAQEAEEGEAHE